MRVGGHTFGLEIRRQRERRYADSGVPMVELWASGPNCIFRRLSGVIDSGSKLTFISARTAALLAIPQSHYPQHMPAAGGRIEFTTARVQFRLPLRDRPPVSFYLDVGVSRQIGYALFGNDLLQYFRILVGRDEVYFLGDERTGGIDAR